MGYRVKTMLSRHASSLYWLGRYHERAEFLARFLQVKYFSTMDSTMIEYRDFTLRSILFMSTGEPTKETNYNEGEILWELGLNPNSQTSILHYINQVRDNTKGVRNLISNELWESINKNYHFVHNFDSEHLKTRGLYEFTHGVQENAALFHSKLDHSILHDNIWAFVKLGIYIERIYQVTKGLLNTFIDVNSLKTEKRNLPLENYQWAITLQVFEGLDMTKKLFKSSVQEQNTCEFLISSLDFPRSISFCFAQVNKILEKIKQSNAQINHDKSSLEFVSAKLAASLKYMEYNDENNSIQTSLNHTLKEIMVINDLIHQDFFDYNQ